MSILAITAGAGHKLGEVGFVLVAVAGIVLALSPRSPATSQTGKTVSGAVLALGAVLVIIAMHSGHFG